MKEIKIENKIFEIPDWFIKKNEIDFHCIQETEINKIKETEKAILVGNTDVQLWIPKSILTKISEEKKDDSLDNLTLDEIENLIKNNPQKISENYDKILDQLYGRPESEQKKARELKRKVRNLK